MKYLIYFPESYDKRNTEMYPLILFLHGVGERGDRVEIVRRNALPKALEEGLEIPFIVIAPQCPNNARWEPVILNTLLLEITEKYPVDRNRIYLTGLSMGGFGTWRLAIEYPDWFAAIAPICGGGFPAQAYRIKNIPIWAFHGAKDKIVPMERSKEMVEVLEKLGANVKFTVYPDLEHDSWTITYQNKALYEWFLNNEKRIL